MDTDSYGLPSQIFGPHPDEFYGAVGRVALLSALLEQQLADIRHTLARARQGEYTHQPVSQQIEIATKLASSLPEERMTTVGGYLSRARAAVEQRNAVIHSIFPAQSSGELIGHRPVRDKTVLDGSASWTRIDFKGLRDLIGELAQLVLEFNSVHQQCQPVQS